MEKTIEQTEVLPQLTTGMTKRQIQNLAFGSVEKLLESGSVVQAAEAMKSMEEFLKALRNDERFIDALREELVKNNGKVRTPSGALIEVCEAGVQYDYSTDDEWRRLAAAADEAVLQLKNREALLRTVPAGRKVIDDESGEVLACGPRKTSTSTYRVTLKKG